MKCIVTFHTIADAMHMEQLTKKNGIPGRLIPVPREISSGWGIAWSSDSEEEEKLRSLIYQQEVEIEDFVLLKR